MAAPIRLVFCITELDPGGAERALTQLVLSLNRAEWESHVFCLGPRGHFADVLEAAHIQVVYFNAVGLLSFPRALFRLTRELRRVRPALVQTFLFHANILGRIAARLAGIRAVVSGLRVAERRNRWHGRVDRWTNFLVAKNVCVSQGVADDAVTNAGLRRDKLVVIPNSVDFERFARVRPADLFEFGIPNGCRMFISIGRLERQKGIDILLDAIEILNQQHPVRDDLHFLIVGDGPDARSLRQQVEIRGLSEFVHFANRRDDIPELLAASTALVLPSRWEGMPNVVLEAMAAGRSVIASNVEGISELVQNRVTGLTVPPENASELATAIWAIAADQNFTSSAGKTAQDIVIKYFTASIVRDAYTKIYRELLKQS